MSLIIPIRHLSFESDWLYENERRLDGSFYLNEGTEALIKIKDKGIKIEDLGNYLDNVFYPNRFSRDYVSPEHGVKFLSSKDMLRYEFDNVKYISKTTKNLDDYILKDNWILVSRSGTIGNVSLVYDDIRDLAGTEHIIRLVPKKDAPYGYLYAFLNSKIGHELLKGPTFGSVVDEIEPDHIKRVPIIVLEKKKQDIHKKIQDVFKWRTEANRLISESLELFYKRLELPKLESSEKYLYNSKIKSWNITSFSHSLRLDANYYNSDAQKAISIIKKTKNKKWVKKLYEITKDVINPPRSSRIYVDESKGIPYYSGTNLTEFSKHDLKFLAKIHKQVEEVKVKKGWILVTRVGTIGIPHFVDESKDGHCVSDNILRVIPNEEILPEYLYIFFRSIYGQLQLNQIKTGAVQDYIPEDYMNDITLLNPDKPIQEEIASKVKEAYQLRAKGEKIEKECSMEFNSLI